MSSLHLSRKCIFEQLSKLSIVSLSKANCCSSRNRSTSIADIGICPVQVLESVSNSGLDVEPAACILWLLLDPGDWSILVSLEVGDESLEREWAQALNSEDGNVIAASPLPLVL